MRTNKSFDYSAVLAFLEFVFKSSTCENSYCTSSKNYKRIIIPCPHLNCLIIWVWTPPIIKTEKPKLAYKQGRLASVQKEDKYWNYEANLQRSFKNVRL